MEDLTPRVDTGEKSADNPAGPSSKEGADPGLAREMSLAELFPAEVALGAATPETLQGGAIADVQGDGVGSDSGPASAMPLVAGIVVTLTILLGGGGLLWWRNRDTAYWPA